MYLGKYDGNPGVLHPPQPLAEAGASGAAPSQRLQIPRPLLTIGATLMQPARSPITLFLRDLPVPWRLAAAAAFVVAALGLGPFASHAQAADDCDGFRWNVAREHALFLGAYDSIVAGSSAAAAPRLAVERLHALTLKPQGQVSFETAPGKSTSPDGTYAGLLRFAIDRPGVYRVSLDAPFWIDVVGGGLLLKAKDYQGQASCDAPHKIVAFDLSSVGEYTLQISGSSKTVVHATVTRADE